MHFPCVYCLPETRTSRGIYPRSQHKVLHILSVHVDSIRKAEYLCSEYKTALKAVLYVLDIDLSLCAVHKYIELTNWKCVLRRIEPSALIDNDRWYFLGLLVWWANRGGYSVIAWETGTYPLIIISHLHLWARSKYSFPGFCHYVQTLLISIISWGEG